MYEMHSGMLCLHNWCLIEDDDDESAFELLGQDEE